MSTVPDLSAYGIDTAAGLRQLDFDAALYTRFLAAFSQEDSALRLQNALARGDAKAAFECAHELKGLAAQLGLALLARHASALCAALRDSSAPDALSRAQALLPSLLRAHGLTLRGIALINAPES